MFTSCIQLYTKFSFYYNIMKDKVINTRITKDLYEKVFEKAKKHGTTVSNLVRGMIEDTFEICGDISLILDKEIRKRFKSKIKIIGYQKVIVGNKVTCPGCSQKVIKGAEGYIAIAENGKASNIIICNKCVKKI